MVFHIFSRELQKLVAKRFKGHTQVQLEGIPAVHRGENVLILAPTGLGKTETAMLPIFDLFLRGKHRPITILYITPLKALNRDMLKRIIWWAENLAFEASVRHGDTTQYERSMQAANPPDMLITTPETLQSIMTGKILREHLKNVRFVVVDEVHELVDGKRGVQLSLGLERLKAITGEPFQIIGLSATVSRPERVAEFLTAGKPCRIVDTAKVRDLKLRVESPETSKGDRLKGSLVFVGPDVAARLRRIDQLIKKARSVLAFTNTRQSAEIISSRLRAIDPKLPIDTHHSSLSKDVRVKAEDEFKLGKLKALMCTSSLELGIDIGSIDLVLQYMSPRQVIKVLQRVGRSGHSLEKISEGVIIAGDPEDCMESCIIARDALKGRMEPTQVYGKSLDVLGHQIVGLALEEYKIPVRKAFEILKGSWLYRDMTKKEFMDVAMLMQHLGHVWIDTMYSEVPVIKRRKRAFTYYYRNLSTIADVKHYKIVDITTNKHVGTLDAEFIALHGSPGTSFIVKGQAWKIIEVSHGRVTVEPKAGLEAAIPAWEGELLPVPWDIAQGVGRLRSEVTENLKEKPLGYLTRKYPINKDVAQKITGYIKKQKKWGFVPDDRNLLVEYANLDRENYVIIHSCFGSLVNDTLGRAITSLLIGKLGSMGFQSDPYRIMIKLQRLGDWKDVLDTLKNMTGKQLKDVLETSLPNTELFHWRFLHVAQRLGIISREAEFGPRYLQKIIEVYAGTPAFKEALHEIFEEKLDLDGALEFLKLLKSGKLRLEVRPGLSPMGEAGLLHRYEIVAPPRAEKEIFSVFKKRLLDTRVGLVCTNCGEYGVTKKVRDARGRLACPRCGASTIGIAPSRYILEAQNLIRKKLAGKNITKEEGKYLKSLQRSASIVMESGSDAVKVLAGRGIGPVGAGRVLARQLKGDDLLKAILEQEKVWARTKKFWKG